jgi:hypothetical protein
MIEKIKVEFVGRENYRLYNLVIEQLSKVIKELGYVVLNFKDLEDNGFEMDTYKLQDAMTDIAMVFAGTVDGLRYIKPSKESEVRDED